jgi:hypothetical protein
MFTCYTLLCQNDPMDRVNRGLKRVGGVIVWIWHTHCFIYGRPEWVGGNDEEERILCVNAVWWES